MARFSACLPCARSSPRWSRDYGGPARADQIAITAGCNQAFAATIATLARRRRRGHPADALVFQSQDVARHVRRHLGPAADRSRPIPDADTRRRADHRRTRAIVLVTPEQSRRRRIPGRNSRAFLDLAPRPRHHADRRRNLPRFRQPDRRAARLFSNPDWDDTLIQLYSFSKAYRLTGHRVGAIIAHPARLAEIEKFLDTVAICPTSWASAPRSGACATSASGSRANVTRSSTGAPRSPTISATLPEAGSSGLRRLFRLSRTSLRPPLGPARAGARAPRPAFCASRHDVQARGRPRRQRELRIAFANVDRAGIAEFSNVWRRLTPDPCPAGHGPLRTQRDAKRRRSLPIMADKKKRNAIRRLDRPDPARRGPGGVRRRQLLAAPSGGRHGRDKEITIGPTSAPCEQTCARSRHSRQPADLPAGPVLRPRPQRAVTGRDRAHPRQRGRGLGLSVGDAERARRGAAQPSLPVPDRQFRPRGLCQALRRRSA